MYAIIMTLADNNDDMNTTSTTTVVANTEQQARDVITTMLDTIAAQPSASHYNTALNAVRQSHFHDEVEVKPCFDAKHLRGALITCSYAKN